MTARDRADGIKLQAPEIADDIEDAVRVAARPRPRQALPGDSQTARESGRNDRVGQRLPACDAVGGHAFRQTGFDLGV
jgi:hypothetical protein